MVMTENQIKAFKTKGELDTNVESSAIQNPALGGQLTDQAAHLFGRCSYPKLQCLPTLPHSIDETRRKTTIQAERQLMCRYTSTNMQTNRKNKEVKFSTRK